MSIRTFTPVHPMPAAQEPMTILISPAFEAGSASGHDLTATPSLGYDAQGTLYAGYHEYFDEPYEDGYYIGPRPVIEVVRVASRQMVVIVTDHDVFVMGESEYASQVAPSPTVRVSPCYGDELIGTSFWTGEGEGCIEVFVPTHIEGVNVPVVCLPGIEITSFDVDRIADALAVVRGDPRFHAALDAARQAA